MPKAKPGFYVFVLCVNCGKEIILRDAPSPKEKELPAMRIIEANCSRCGAEHLSTEHGTSRKARPPGDGYPQRRRRRRQYHSHHARDSFCSHLPEALRQSPSGVNAKLDCWERRLPRHLGVSCSSLPCRCRQGARARMDQVSRQRRRPLGCELKGARQSPVGL